MEEKTQVRWEKPPVTKAGYVKQSYHPQYSKSVVRNAVLPYKWLGGCCFLKHPAMHRPSIFRDSGNKRSLSCGNGWLLGNQLFFPGIPGEKQTGWWSISGSDTHRIKIIRDLMLSGNCKYVWNDVYCLQRTPPCLSEYVVCWYFNYTSFYRGCLSFVQYFGFAHL